MKTARTLLIGIVTLMACLVGYLCIGMESYCYLCPSIDTRYAPGFSEEKFAQVKIGMTKEEVLHLLGDPFGGAADRPSSRWAYTQDGKCLWADWAWLGREITFVDNRVVKKVSCIYYD